MVRNKKTSSFAIDQAWAAVAYADRINQGQYVNDNTHFEPGEIVKTSNKKLAYLALAHTSTITDEDRATGQLLADHFQGLLFRTLKGSTTNQRDFLDTIANIVAMTEVGRFEVACMSTLPKTYARDLARVVKDERQLALAPTSTYLGSVGDKLQTTVEIIDCVYSRNYNIYIYTATDNKNIIKFTSVKSSDVFKSGISLAVKGTVKRHSVNDRTGVSETWLNRVKVV